MTSQEIRQRFLDFFKERGHSIIPSASLVPENDPSVLFNTAGMQPLVPYLLGQEHPQGKRLVDIQKCVRTNDIDEVGDNTHLTFFEMMGNWSLGDYWKKESINWSYELLTDKEKGFGLDPQRLYVTCFEGDENAPKDEESAQIWKEIFEKNNVSGERIYFRPAKDNWWPQPKEKDEYSGPCGPDTEMFYDLTGKLNSGMTLEKYLEADDKQEVVEIWNNVFMQYLKKDGKVIGELDKKNVDTGAGFERVVAVVQEKESVFDTDLFKDVIDKIKDLSFVKDKKELNKGSRVIADHIRASVFLISDGVIPSNSEQGYILRRLIRVAIRWTDSLGIVEGELKNICDIFIEKYKNIYLNIIKNKDKILEIINSEESKFRLKLKEGIQFIGKKDPFILYTSYGIPFELTDSILVAQGKKRPDFEKFKNDMKQHQEVSRQGSEHKFKGGLSGNGEMETKYHTATHLLHQALRDVLGDSVQQKGSNITSERLRFDFAFERKMTDEEKNKVEDIVNEKIKLNLPVNKVIMKKDEAEKTGALHFFGDKYGDEVNVYYIGDNLENAYSKEFCGGPHVENTGILGKFKISKEEAVSAGVRRIKAILE